MLSIDTHILLHAFHEGSPNHRATYDWIASLRSEENVAISECILSEFYGLLRSGAVFKQPLSAEEACKVIRAYRVHPLCRLIGFLTENRALHDALWKKAGTRGFAFRRL